MKVITSKIRPIGDRILLQRHKESDQMSGGIVIPDRAKDKPLEATVVAVGTGRKTDKGISLPSELKVGDRVLIGQYGGDEVRLGDVVYTLMREDDIHAILGEAANEAKTENLELSLTK